MLKKKYRLRKKKEYTYVYKKGKKYIGEYILIYKRLSNEKKIGFSVSKKIGNAVIRNLYKRRFRYIIKKYFLMFNTNHYIIVANKTNNQATYKQLEKDIFLLIQKIQKNEEKNIVEHV